MLRKLLIEEDEEVDENTYIYNAEFFYEPEFDIDKITLSNSDQEGEDEDSGPIYDTDGEEEFIEEIEEEINFVVGDEIVESMVEEINFVDMDKIVKEMEIFVEPQNSFQDYKCHKNSRSHIFCEHNSFSKDLKEIQIGSFIDQEGFFVFHLHVLF